MNKKLLSVALAGTMALTAVGLAACGEQKGENELWITFYKGGYGEEWVKQLAEKFEQENEGVSVKYDADTMLIDAVPNMMENGTNYDLIFCHDVAWEDFVAHGWIENLDDLYNTPVSAGGTFKDRIWDEDVLESCAYTTNNESHYYKVPWTIGTAGIAYNLTVMERISEWTKENKGREWKTAPQTYYELLLYCEDIVDANLRVDESKKTSPVIKPFTWSGKGEEYQWDYVLFDWWGQLAGPETMNVFKNFGNVTQDNKLDWSKVNEPDVNVLNPALSAKDNNGVGWAEFRQAYALWYNLVVTHTAWSTAESQTNSKFNNEQAFANGAAAMAPAACWIENESKSYLEKSKQTISLMPTPTIENVAMNDNYEVLPEGTTGTVTLDAIRGEQGAPKTLTTKNGNTYNRVSFTSSFGDSVMIPAKSSQKDLAKQFILFMQEEENAKLFTRTSGGTVLPYKYEYWKSFVDETGKDNASAWQASIFEIDRNSTKFNNYTQHPMMRDTNLKSTARMTSVWPENEYYYTKAFSNPAAEDYKPAKLISDIFNTQKNKWETYKLDYIRK